MKRLELTMPNRRATCMHLFNLTLFLVICFVATVTGLLMVQLYSGDDNKIKDKDVAIYLQDSYRFEISFGLAYLFDSISTLIAGHVIVLYSRDSKSNLRVDPLTGMQVPSLIFVYNMQQIIDCVAGVRSETPEQFKERMKRQNLDYMRRFIEGYVL